MRSLRNLAYAAVLTLSAFNFSPSLATAQDARGSFTLSHDVRWQNAVVPAGEYRFSVENKGPSELLMLRRICGSPVGFMLLVTDTETESKVAITPSRLLLVSQSGKTYVSKMDLPQFRITLHFAVPAEIPEKQVADGRLVSASGSAR
jgi:hypothetical protein